MFDDDNVLGKTNVYTSNTVTGVRIRIRNLALPAMWGWRITRCGMWVNKCGRSKMYRAWA